MNSDAFAAELEAEPIHRLGERALLTISLRSRSDRTCRLLSWGTPFEHELSKDCLAVERDGEPIAYDGKLVKRGDPVAEDYVTLGPGEELRASFDLSDAYPIDAVGRYTVSVRTAFPDAFAVSDGEGAGGPRRESFEPLSLVTDPVSFECVPGDEPRPTAGQLMRGASRPVAADALGSDMLGGTLEQQRQVYFAHRNAQVYAARAASQLRGTPGASNALYKRLFGSFDPGRYEKVTQCFERVSTALRLQHVTYDLHGTDCSKPNVNAKTHFGSSTVWLCPPFFSHPDLGSNSTFGIVIHEWTHALSNTDDNAYSTADSEKLAAGNPQAAVENADSYQGFAEEVAQSEFGKSLTFIADRTRFSRDEVNAMLAHSPRAAIDEAFYVVAEGFTPKELAVGESSLSGPPGVAPTIAVRPRIPGMSVRATRLRATKTIPLTPEPQRFTWVYEIAFTDDSGFPTGPGEVEVATLIASHFSRSSSAPIELVREPSPYELDGPTPWLSTDLRVFKLRAGESRFGANIGSTPASARTYIERALHNLNGNPGGGAFDAIPTDPQRCVLELAEKFGGTRVFNFAIAKVRYRGSVDLNDVRVFFRLFPASTTSTAYDQLSTYRRRQQGTRAVPLLGLTADNELLTIPCFAAARVNSAAESIVNQNDPVNVRSIAANADGSESVAYFGCWLDINQTQPELPRRALPADGPWPGDRRSVQELMRNAHQCLVAEIAFDPEPIDPWSTPGGSDKLAQRNLVTVDSANPGFEASRRVLTTFDLRSATPNGGPGSEPEELLFDWGDVPADSVATVYVPEVAPGHIVELADELYPGHGLEVFDEEAVRAPVGGIAYLPLPTGSPPDLTGLLSIELPDGIRRGRDYTAIVRQVTEGGVVRTSEGMVPWRKIVGSFQLTIPVRTKDATLPRERRLLAVLKWILQSMSTDERWYPSFSRYVNLLEDRVDALGGKSAAIPASTSGDGKDEVWDPGDWGQAEPAPGGKPHRPAGVTAIWVLLWVLAALGVFTGAYLIAGHDDTDLIAALKSSAGAILGCGVASLVVGVITAGAAWALGKLGSLSRWIVATVALGNLAISATSFLLLQGVTRAGAIVELLLALTVLSILTTDKSSQEFFP